MTIITLLTDFGTSDEYVGVMKGAILSINPHAIIVDISHHIDPQDMIHAAYMLQASYEYFPPGTVHTAVVDPGVGTSRAIIALRIKEHIFLAPDNGILTLIMNQETPDDIICVENPTYFLKNISQTFHGRDIFAPVAAHISAGVRLTELGTALTPKTLVRLPISEPHVSTTGELTGHIISIDRFGNLITNIDSRRLVEFCNPDMEKNLEIYVGLHKITNLSPSYAGGSPQMPLAIMGSRGYLEIAVNGGNAQDYLMAVKGDRITVRIRNQA